MPPKPKPAFSPPKALGACADLLYTTRQDRLAEQKDIVEYEVREKVLKDYLIATLPKSDASGVAGKLARVTIVRKVVPSVEDWDKLYEFIRKKKRFGLLNRALNAAAVQEMWDNGEAVPGVGRFDAVTVSVNKL